MTQRGAMIDLGHLRAAIVTAAANAGEGHIPSALSILDIVWVLYSRVLQTAPDDQFRDVFILSKGHGCLAHYAVLKTMGYPIGSLGLFGQKESKLGGHPDWRKVSGVEASTGSLGHGLAIGVGIATGMRLRNVKARTVVLVGDGECNEGSVWEAAMLAAHLQLKLTCIVDDNGSTNMGSISAKFAACGWGTVDIGGHDHDQIYDAVTAQEPGYPRAIIARTVKGRGIERMESNPAWHHRAPDPIELEEILQELTLGQTHGTPTTSFR